MFDNLMESRHVRRPRAGGSLASVALHGAVIAALVAATANAGIVAPDEPPAEELIYTHNPPVTPPPPSAATRPVQAPSESGAPAPADLSTVMPAISDIIPDVLPAIDLARAVTSDDDFRRSRTAARDDAVRSPGVSGDGGPFTERTVDLPVVMMPGSRSPDYPAALRSAGIEGGVLVQFVVDTAGRIEPDSWRIVQTDDPAFADAVRRVLPGLRFRPAEAAGRRVRQLVQLPFRFDLDRE